MNLFAAYPLRITIPLILLFFAAAEGIYNLIEGNWAFYNSLFMLSLLFCVWFFFSLVMTRRVNQIVSTARRFAMGDPEARVRLTGNDELAMIAQAIDQMADKIVMNAAEKNMVLQKIQDASEYARGLIEASLDPLVAINEKGNVMDINEATVQVTGVPRHKLLGSDFTIYFTQPERARIGYLQVLQAGLLRNYPLAIRHRDGHVIPVSFNATVYRDEQGKAAGVFAAIRTEERRQNTEDRAQRTDKQRF